MGAADRQPDDQPSTQHKAQPKIQPKTQLKMMCEGCGFQYRLDEATAAGALIVDGAAIVAELLREAGQDASDRIDLETWSPLEYGCHIRDVLIVQRERLLLALREENPVVVPMGREQRVEHDGYSGQDPAEVAAQVRSSAALLANALSRLHPADWDRTIIYNYPEPASRSLRWLAVHTLHEVEHHLGDIRRQVITDPSR